MKKWVKSHFFLLAIILVAVLLRFINLGTIPIGFNDDEAAFGYNAYSILKTGRDEWGRFLPFPVFESFGDWKLVGYLYLTVFSQFFFGVSEFTTRLPSAVFGVLAVWATYLLTKKLFETGTNKSDPSLITHHSSLKSVALLAALFLAISPWHTVASRNAFESDLLVFAITIATYFFLKGLKNPKWLTASFVTWAVSFYIYRSSWLFVPLFVIALIYLHWNQLKKFKGVLAKNLVVLLILILPLVPMVMTFKGQSRFFQESFIAGVQRSGIIDEVNQRRGSCIAYLPRELCVLIYNRYTFYIPTYFNNYFSNLSWETYYISGNRTGYQSAPLRGFFYIFELPIFLIGLFSLIKLKHPSLKILIVWILLVPLGASLTGVGNPGRLNILMPVPQIIAAVGLFSLFAQIKRLWVARLLMFFVTIVVISSLTRFVVDMLYYYPKIASRYQRYGYNQLFDFLESQKSKYRQIAISRKSDDAKQYIHYLFYEKYEPKIYQDSVVRTRDEGGWGVIEKIDNLNFYSSTPSLENLPVSSLLAVGEAEVIFPIKPIFTVDDLNGDRLFEVYDVDQVREALKNVQKQ